MHRRKGPLATVEDQLAWLQQAGFTEVAYQWRHLNFAIFSGHKGTHG